jgi:protein ImuB
VVVTADVSTRTLVIAANSEAKAAGVRAGMRLTAACALAPDLAVLRRDPAEETATLDGLAAWSGQFTSFTSIEQQGLLLEIGGSLKLFGGLDALCRRVKAGVQMLGYDALTGVGPTPSGAWLLARAGLDVPVVSPALLSGRLAPVPVEYLGLPARALEDLRRMGVRSFGDCCRLPRDGLARRISPQLVALLDRALGRRPDPRRPYTPPLVFERCINPPFEIRDTAALLAAARLLMNELCGFLSARAGGVQNLEIHLAHQRVFATRLTLSLAAPGRDADQLLTLLEARMARITLAEPVVSVGIRATEILPLALGNHDLYAPPNEAGWDWKTLLAHLQARLSVECVYGLGTHADYRPERAWRAESSRGQFLRTAFQKEASAQKADGFSPRRPFWLLKSPRRLPITAGGAPRWHGKLALRSGPERIESGWWDDAHVARDYYVAANPRNQLCWIFRELGASRGWYLHGMFG